MADEQYIPGSDEMDVAEAKRNRGRSPIRFELKDGNEFVEIDCVGANYPVTIKVALLSDNTLVIHKVEHGRSKLIYSC